MLLVLSTSGTFAYFTDEDEKVNEFKTGELEIVLEEPEWRPEKGTGILPGDTWIKDPTVEAQKGDAYIQLELEILDGSGQAIAEADRLKLIQSLIRYDASGMLTEQEICSAEQAESSPMVNPAFEKYREEGNKLIFRYTENEGILHEGERAVLFNRIAVPKEFNNEQMAVLNGDRYQKDTDGRIEILERGSGFQIKVSAKAVQSENFSWTEENWEGVWTQSRGSL